jgi:hypothetical protein
MKRYFDPEYNRIVEEEVIQKQYAWFKEQEWNDESYEDFKSKNFREIRVLTPEQIKDIQKDLEATEEDIQNLFEATQTELWDKVHDSKLYNSDKYWEAMDVLYKYK